MDIGVVIVSVLVSESDYLDLLNVNLADVDVTKEMNSVMVIVNLMNVVEARFLFVN